MKEKIIKITRMFCLICICFHLCFFKSDAEENTFIGVRMIEVKADQSDMENFVNGGRTVLDFVVRKHAPEWLNYTSKTVGRDVYISFSFEFVSYDDYCVKIEELLQYAPSVVRIEDDGFFLMENFESKELLNFFYAALIENSCLIEKKPEVLFSNISLDTVEVNNKEYKIEGKVDIRPKGKENIKFDEIELVTQGKKDGTFDRSILVKINTASKGQKSVEEIIERFRHTAKITEEYPTGGGVKITAEFNALNAEELVKNTMICLNAATSIQETEEYVNDTTIKVKRVEFIDLPSILKEEGTFHYFYEFPSYYKNVVGKEGSVVNINETNITAENESYVECYYERGFQFDEIEISSDFSDCSGGKTRIVKMSADIDMARSYHEKIKGELSDKLQRGMVLDIYDDGGRRYYKITYSSYLMKDIEEFSEAILGSVCRINRNESWIPFDESSLKENILINEVFPQMAPAKEMVVSYKLLPMSRISDIKEDFVSVEENIITYRGGNSVSVDIKYKTLNLLKCVVEIIGIVFFIIFTLIVYMKFKKILKRRKQNKDEAKSVKEQEEGKHVTENLLEEECLSKENYLDIPGDINEKIEMQCPKCGNTVSSEAKFCGKCGGLIQASNEIRMDLEKEN